MTDEKEIETLLNKVLDEDTTYSIMDFINTHYIPRKPTGFQTVRKITSINNPEIEIITEPITQEELVEVVGKMLDALKFYENFVDTEHPDRELPAKNALTFNGGRIEREEKG